jgi:hypothetical protein
MAFSVSPSRSSTGRATRLFMIISKNAADIRKQHGAVAWNRHPSPLTLHENGAASPSSSNLSSIRRVVVRPHRNADGTSMIVRPGGRATRRRSAPSTAGLPLLRSGLLSSLCGRKGCVDIKAPRPIAVRMCRLHSRSADQSEDRLHDQPLRCSR